MTPIEKPSNAATRADAVAPSEEAPDGATAAEQASAEGELAALWPVFLERLGKQKISLAAYLMDAKPLRRHQGIVTIGLPGFSLHHEVLTDADNRRLIDQLFSELCHGRVTVQYATLPASAEPTDASAAAVTAPPPIVQDIVNLFNATILNNPPRPAAE